jgi:methylmalonyl-CoA mutase
MTGPLPLADGFPTFKEADWRVAVTRTRRGAPSTDGTPTEGIPLYQRRSGNRAVAGRPAGQPWRIVERIDAGTIDGVAEATAEAVSGGASGVELVFASALHPLKGEIVPADAASVASALAGVIPDGLHLRVDAEGPAPDFTDPFVELARTRKAELVFAFDPVAARALGRGPGSDEAGAIRAALAAFDAPAVVGAVVTADGRLWHAGGATEEQELGVTVATFASHIRLLDSAERIGITLAVDSDQFRGIAKLRAMRLLLARVLEVAGIASAPPRIHAETAWRTLAVRDPEMNILRATSAAFAAACGGADSIAVLPFDAAAAEDGGAAHRLARNTQIILAEEAHLFRVADPGAGAGTIEALTATFAEAGWKRFQAIESEGGILAAIAEGSLLRDIAEAREARLARVARSEVKMIGVNAFRGEATTATVKRVPVKRTGPLTFKRLSEQFESAP